MRVREMLFKVSPYLYRHFDITATTTTQAYLEELHRQQQWRERLRHRLCAIVFLAPHSSEDFRQHAIEFVTLRTFTSSSSQIARPQRL